MNSGFGRIWDRMRLQLGGGLLFACALPLLLRVDMALTEKLSGSAQLNSFIAATCAVLAGYFFVRRLTRFPGVTAISYILPTFAVSYGAVLLAIVIFRIDYSRFFLMLSFLFAQFWFHFVYVMSKRAVRATFAIVPAGKVDRLKSIPDVNWEWLTRPELTGKPPNGLVADLRADFGRLREWETFIAETAVRGIPVYHYKQIGETLTGKVEIEHLSENTLGSLLPNLVYLRFKQSLDVAGAVLVIPFLLPLFAIIGLWIRNDSPGPVFFRQQRMGYRGRPFRVWKFRTMVHDPAGDIVDRDTSITTDGDPRITRVGRFLRKTRLDELPQVLNILRGEMSWIGPRPEALALSQWYESEIPFYRYRHIVRPGISGWAQVNQGHVADVSEVHGKLHYDFYYIKNYSIWLDIVITIRTAVIVITGFGAR